MRYEATIIGAGPAGSTAAYYLARRGVPVLLLDRSDFPRPKACAGALFDSERWRFENFLKIKDRLSAQPVEEAAFYHGRAPLFSLRRPGLFNQVRRDEFDHLLLQQALEQGAQFRRFQVKGIERQGGDYLLSDGREAIRTRTLIGAEGFGGPTARFLGNPRPAFVRCMEYDIRCERRDAQSHFFFLWGGDLGYAWLFPTLEGYYAGLGYLGNPDRTVRSHLEEFLAHLVQQGLVPRQHEIRRVFGGPDPLSVAARYSAENLLLCGDAMGLVNQMSGDGISFAMQSGMLAAEAYGEGMERNYRRLIRPVVRSVTLFPFLPPKPVSLVFSRLVLQGMRHLPPVRRAVLRRFFERRGVGIDA